MTPPIVHALSISSSVSGRLKGAVRRGAVIHSHARSCSIILEPQANAETGEPLVITLAEPSIENGPLNILLENFSLIEKSSAPGLPAFYDGSHLKLARADICFRDAIQWNPKPDWRKARAAEKRGQEMQTQLLHQAQSLANRATLLDFLAPMPPASNSAIEDTLSKRFAAVFMQMDQKSNSSVKESLAFGAEHLAGLGAGLTPAGDDFLCGAMLAVWLVRDDAVQLCKIPAETAARRTTTLSAALLRESAKGHCSMSWQRFIAALATREPRSVESALSGILSHGATSGGDSLAGFFWAIKKLDAVNHAPS